MRYNTLITAINAGKMVGKIGKPSKAYYQKVEVALSMFGKNFKDFKLFPDNSKFLKKEFIFEENDYLNSSSNGKSVIIRLMMKNNIDGEFWNEYRIDNFDFYGALDFLKKMKREL